MLATLITSMLIGVMMPTVEMENAWLAGQIPTNLPYPITQRMPPASTLAAGIQVPTRILHSSVSIRTAVYLTNMSQKSFQGLNIDPRLLLHPGLLVLYQASLQSDRTSARPSEATILFSQTNLPGLFRHLIHLIWIRNISVSVTPLALGQKSVSHAADEIIVYHVGMPSVKTSTKHSCNTQ